MNSLTECPIATTPVPTRQKIESTAAGERRTPDNNGILQPIKI